jgi:hypothetical protein
MSEGYESFYLRAAAPTGGLGLWIRYTVHRAPGGAPRGSLWFTLFDADAPGPTAAKKTVDGPRDDTGAWIRIDDATLGPHGARGSIEVPSGGQVSWDLSFSGAPMYPHLPRSWMYDAPLPRTKPVSLHPTARFDGTLVVGDRTVSVDGWPGMVGHNWGSEHAERWIWLHGTGFAGHEDAWLDVVLARLRLGRWTTPWSGFGALSLDGRRHELGGLAHARSTRVDEHPDHLDFTLAGHRLRVEGRVSAPKKDFVGWVYADPDGSGHDVAHCSIADLELTLQGEAVPPATLRARGAAAYELGMREHDHGIAIQPYTDG